MRKILLLWGVVFIYSSGLYGESMRGEMKKSDYDIVSMTSKIGIKCENGSKTFIEKRNNFYYTSKHKKFKAFKKAAKYACGLKFIKKISTKRINAKLGRNALVCRTEKSMIHALKSNRNYRLLLYKLQSRDLYKNCFIGVSNYKVTVTNHYYNKSLIKNYYKMKYGNNIRYVPINAIKPLNKRKKYKKRHFSHKKIKKYLHKKRVKHRTSKLKGRIKNKYKDQIVRYSDRSENVSSTQKMNDNHPNRMMSDFQKVDTESIKEHTNANIDTTNSYKLIEKEPKAVENSDTNTLEVYRCSASSMLTGKIYTGQHLDRDSSEKLALKNCKIEHENVENCQFEHCFILKLM